MGLQYPPFCNIQRLSALSPGWQRSWPGNIALGFIAAQSICLAGTSSSFMSSDSLKTGSRSSDMIFPLRCRGSSANSSASWMSAPQLVFQWSGQQLESTGGFLHRPKSQFRCVSPLLNHVLSRASLLYLDEIAPSLYQQVWRAKHGTKSLMLDLGKQITCLSYPSITEIWHCFLAKLSWELSGWHPCLHVLYKDYVRGSFSSSWPQVFFSQDWALKHPLKK